MRKLSSEEFKRLTEAGYESRRIEFKPSFTWNDLRSSALKEKIIQTILGFANTRDGGDIIIGISERRNSQTPQLLGLDGDQFKSFKYDKLKQVVDSFASAAVNFSILEASKGNNQFVVVRVSEFDESPIVCKKNGKNTRFLRQGDIYCRSRTGAPATVRSTDIELREIIELAVDKQIRKLRRRGYIIEEKENKDRLFDEQIRDLK